MQTDKVEEMLGYRFKNSGLLRAALTHSSIARKRGAPSDYERMEFLGEAVLELVVSLELYRLYPEASEGELTSMRAAIVSRRHLSELSTHFGWGDQLTMSGALEKAGGRTAPSVLGNTFETLIGAVALDADFETARAVTLRLLGNSLRERPAPGDNNPKGTLQERLQAINGEAPDYEVLQIREHPPLFRAIARWQGRIIGQGEGTGKRRAEQAAAVASLSRALFEVSPCSPQSRSSHDCMPDEKEM